MAGSTSAAPDLTHAATGSAARATHSSFSEIWRRSTPFAHLSASARADYLREYGMHDGIAAFRVGTDAFEVRSDIEVGDACETAAQLLRALIGTLEVLSVSPDTSALQKDACSACAFLAKQTAGALAVIAAGVFPGYPAQPASNDE